MKGGSAGKWLAHGSEGCLPSWLKRGREGKKFKEGVPYAWEVPTTR